MSATPLVSIIISAFNVEKYILESIHSILNQGYTNLDVIIADDASTDNTRMIIDSVTDPRVRRYHNHENKGLLNTWNLLLPLAKGEYITFQDGDDISLHNRIEKLVSFLEKNPDVGLCGSNFIRYFSFWGLHQQSNYPLTDEAIRSEFKKENVPFNGTRVMIRRSVYLAVGGFREYFKGLAAEDYDWILRIADQFKVANIPEVLYEYRYFSKSASKNSLQSSPERIFVIKTIFFLKQQREELGADALQQNRPDLIAEFIKPYQTKLEMDKTNYLRFDRVFSNCIANKDFLSAWKLLIERIFHYPFETRNLFDGFRLSSSIGRTVVRSFMSRFKANQRKQLV